MTQTILIVDDEKHMVSLLQSYLTQEGYRLVTAYNGRDARKRARDDDGSGSGLAIAKSIVEMHGGKIWAESETGQGLKVMIEIQKTL